MIKNLGIAHLNFFFTFVFSSTSFKKSSQYRLKKFLRIYEVKN
jgi:hypothetical protein